MDYSQASELSFMNRESIEKSERCGCFYCLATFPPNDIQEWVDDGETAICPFCGIDSVIGTEVCSNMNEEILEQMRENSFGIRIGLREDPVPE